MKGPAVVVGNGPSRLQHRLDDLRGLAVVMGCNALYRDHPWVDYLGVVDDGIHQEVVASGWEPPRQLVVRYRFEEKRNVVEHDGTVSRVVRDRNFATGPMTVSFAVDSGFAPVYLVGMEANHASVYAGTANYASTPAERALRDEEPEWVAQVARLAREHPGVLVQVGPPLCGLPRLDWDGLLRALRQVSV